MITLHWKLANNRFASGETLYIGEVCVGAIYIDPFTPRGNERAFVVRCMLPGKHMALGKQPTMADGKRVLEKAVRLWLKQAGITADA